MTQGAGSQLGGPPFSLSVAQLLPKYNAADRTMLTKISPDAENREEDALATKDTGAVDLQAQTTPTPVGSAGAAPIGASPGTSGTFAESKKIPK